jgi:hypothetical protein
LQGDTKTSQKRERRLFNKEEEGVLIRKEETIGKFRSSQKKKVRKKRTEYASRLLRKAASCDNRRTIH